MSRISELLAGGRTVSVEMWPPRNDAAGARLETALAEIETSIAPAFYSITYGAGGSTRERTHELVVRLHNEFQGTAMAHLVCAAHSQEELSQILGRYAEAGVENILALRGDPPLDADEALRPGELEYAAELVELAKSVGNFCVAVAAHPEGHPSSPDLASDRRFLAAKLEVADFAITQFFFRSEDYLSLVEDLASLGCDKPILPGIMPITNVRTLSKMAQMSGCAIPEDLARRVEAAADDRAEIRRIGVEVATALGAELLDAGAPGLHFYTMNTSATTVSVCRNLGIAVA
jgi:methylenetetrahydrofolate reductase (NADPH)